MDLHDLRREYLLGELRSADLGDDPHDQFAKWMKQAFEMEVVDPPAMTIATVDAHGVPSQRIVLLKHFDAEGFVFYTSYASHKGSRPRSQPEHQPAFSLAQCRAAGAGSGVAERLSVEDSQRYFHSRPRGSQLAAAVSPQSEVVESREALEAAFAALDKSTEGAEVPCPSTWGGYRVRASQIEFWQGGANRLHNRFRYTRDGLTWIIERLAP